MICRKLWLGALAVLALCEAARAAAPTPEQLLPATTTEFVVLSDLRRLEQTWGQSQFGRLLADPVLKPFLDEVYPTTKGANYLFDTIGVSWDTVRNAAGGDLGWGLVLVDGKEVAHVLTLDMAGRREGGNAYFNEIGKCLQKQGARFGQRTYEGMSLVVAELPNGKYILYGHKDDVIVTTDHFGVLGGILARWNNTANDSLANQQAYQKVRARCQTLPGESALIRWYYEPVARVEAQMLFSPELKKVKGDNVAQVLRKEGVDGIKGVGGTLAFVSNGTDILARAAAFAPPPFRGAMRMAKLSNETLASPEAWVPPDVSAWATASIDLPNALDSFETLFERLADEGPGTFQEILKSLKEDKDGPQVDLRHDIFEQMINRVTLINDATLPAQEKSERFLVGLTIKDGRAEKTVADALRKCVESDKRIRARDFEGVRIWEYRPRPSTGKASRTTQPPVVMPSLALAVARQAGIRYNHTDSMPQSVYRFVPKKAAVG
ncbi:MAG: hypothetical protein ACJ8F7_22590, partial [Gemmataceae bacterium]